MPSHTTGLQEQDTGFMMCEMMKEFSLHTSPSTQMVLLYLGSTVAGDIQRGN